MDKARAVQLLRLLARAETVRAAAEGAGKRRDAAVAVPRERDPVGPPLERVVVRVGVDNAGGLSEGLVSREQRRLPVRQVSARLAILPAGQPSGDPMAGLTSDRMRQLVGEAREACEGGESG